MQRIALLLVTVLALSLYSCGTTRLPVGSERTMNLQLFSESRLENETLIPTLTFQKVTEGFQEAALEDREGNRVEFTQEQLLSNSTLTIRWANGEVENCTVTEIMSALCPGCPPVILATYTDPTTGKVKKYVLAPN